MVDYITLNIKCNVLSYCVSDERNEFQKVLFKTMMKSQMLAQNKILESIGKLK